MIRKELVNNPDMLCNDDIQAIGKKYPNEKNIITNFILHSIEPGNAAKQLIEYEEINSPQDKWLFLANFYKDLPESTTHIAIEIRQLFKSAFDLSDFHAKQTEKLHPATGSLMLKKTVEKYYKNQNKFHLFNQATEVRLKVSAPNKLVNSNIQEIGAEYLKRHGDHASGFSRFFHIHTNHSYAKKLQACNMESAEDRWLYLAEIYASLPNNRGELAKEIRTMFINAFHYGASDLKHIGFFTSTAEVAEDMKGMISSNFKKILPLPNIFSAPPVVESDESIKNDIMSGITKSVVNWFMS